MNQIYKCCDRQSLAIMDHKWPLFVNNDEGRIVKVNRMCMRCYTHWAGNEGDVKKFTKAEWNALIEGLFDEDAE